MTQKVERHRFQASASSNVGRLKWNALHTGYGNAAMPMIAVMEMTTEMMTEIITRLVATLPFIHCSLARGRTAPAL